MSAFFFTGIPTYCMRGFSAVRDVYDNLSNVLTLVEIANTCSHCMIRKYNEDFDLVVFSGEYTRALIRKNDGYFSMALPFQVIDHGNYITFNCDHIEVEVGGMFISIMRNALMTSKRGNFCYDEIACSITDDFDLSVDDALRYCDSFVALLADDHGYFRFDDDPKNENGDFHPRYHFDFFIKMRHQLR